MKHFKIITMGILASILSLLGCGYGNKRATQSESINPYIPVAAQITMDKLPGVLKNVKAGRTEYDSKSRLERMGHLKRHSVEVCFRRQDIDFEAMSKDQLPYLNTLKQFAKEHNYPIIETTYNNTPIDYDHVKFAPVLSLKVNADIDSIVHVGKLIEQTIFKNNDQTIYDIVP